MRAICLIFLLACDRKVYNEWEVPDDSSGGSGGGGDDSTPDTGSPALEPDEVEPIDMNLDADLRGVALATDGTPFVAGEDLTLWTIVDGDPWDLATGLDLKSLGAVTLTAEDVPVVGGLDPESIGEMHYYQNTDTYWIEVLHMNHCRTDAVDTAVLSDGSLIIVCADEWGAGRLIFGDTPTQQQPSEEVAARGRSLAVLSDTDIWTVTGEGGLLFHYSGTSFADASAWTEVNAFTDLPDETRNLLAVSPYRGGLVAVGEAGLVAWYDGTTWTTETVGSVEDLTGVWWDEGQGVYAVGVGGVMIWHDGDEWDLIDSDTEADLTDITGQVDGRIVAVGEDGTVMEILRE